MPLLLPHTPEAAPPHPSGITDEDRVAAPDLEGTHVAIAALRNHRTCPDPLEPTRSSVSPRNWSATSISVPPPQTRSTALHGGGWPIPRRVHWRMSKPRSTGWSSVVCWPGGCCRTATRCTDARCVRVEVVQTRERRTLSCRCP